MPGTFTDFTPENIQVLIMEAIEDQIWRDDILRYYYDSQGNCAYENFWK